ATTSMRGGSAAPGSRRARARSTSALVEPGDDREPHPRARARTRAKPRPREAVVSGTPLTLRCFWLRPWRRVVSEFRPQETDSPIYADRLTGEQFVDATSMVNAYLIRFAERAALKNSDGTQAKPQLDDTGYAQVQRGSATIGVNVLEAHGVLMIFSPIMS